MTLMTKQVKRVLLHVGIAALLGAVLPSYGEEGKKDDKKETKEDKWEVLSPPFDLSTVSINTEQTTWSSLDVAPNGKQFVFDMLGDIYLADLAGGQAKALTQDFAWNLHPTISPDGRQIAFISDRDGASNLWVMDIDGTNLKQITKEKEDLIHSPAWRPDGQYLAATKGIVSRRSICAGEIWLYHHSGGKGLAIKERPGGKKEQKNTADPAFSHDGNYLYYTTDTTAGHTFKYNRDPLEGLFSVMRYDIKEGKEERYISGTGGAIVPMPSPDGKYLAFIRRVKEKTALFIKDLATGLEQPVYLDLERDMQEGFGTEGYFARFDWTPDAKSLVFWSGGHFHKLRIKDRKHSTIPLRIEAEVKVAKALRVDVDVAPEHFDVKMLRWTQKSPDGKHMLFQALGKLYIKNLKTGKTRRLTRQNEHDEYYPRYSNDGKKIVYTTWHDQHLGHVRTVSANGGRAKVLTRTPGHYSEPSFSQDGKKVVYRKFTGGYLLDPKYSVEPGIYLSDLRTGKQKRISDTGSEPHFAGKQDRVYFTTSVPGTDYPEHQLVSVDLNGEDRREHLHGSDKVTEFRLSHDKKWVAFVHQYNAYVAPFTDTGKRISLAPDMTSVPVKKISSRAGEYLTWRADSQAVSWFHGPYFFERELKDAFDFVAGAPETLPEPLSEGLNLSFSHKTDTPSGYKALVGAKVITMRQADQQQEVIDNGTVLIKDNKIVAVGKAEDVHIPKGTWVLNVQGKSVIPGLVDAHAHGSQGSDEIIPQQNWLNYSGVAFGVTTQFDPSNDTTEVFSAAELQRAGLRVGPRLYSTGTILYGAHAPGYKANINSYKDALYHVQRMKDAGAIAVKSYNQPRRDQRQQVLAAAKALDMMVVPEGGGKLQQNITMLVDGHTGLEHAIPIARGYQDLTTLWAASDFGYTPTFGVAYGGLMGEEYWYDKTEVWKNERLMRYTPHFLVDKRAIRRPQAPENHYNHFDVATYAKVLRDQGVRVQIGGHGQREGLAAHWELWMMHQGGFSAWEALRGGTIDGATHLGMDKHIGSIEVGKLADLVVIEGDVLRDLRRSEFVVHTVLNGRVYEAATMNELPGKRERQPFFFERNAAHFLPEATEQALAEKAKHHHWVH